MMSTIRLCIALMLVSVGASALSAPRIDLFISPSGDDSATGLTEKTALATLQLALTKASQVTAPDAKEININVGAGTYFGQKIRTEGHPLGIPIIIRPARQGSEMPIFDGKGDGGTWFTLRNDRGRPTRITITGLHIMRYSTAISLNGDREVPTAFNGQNVVDGNTFDTIGQISNPRGPKSTAAVRLVNSRDNQITRNRFSNIKNIEGCSALHSIYMASHASNNLIADNLFDDGCGQTIKARDESNNNVIRNNEFRRQATTATFQEAYCNKDQRGDECTKAAGECPSVGNVYESNIVTMKGSSKSLAPVRVQDGSIPTHCGSKGITNRVTERSTRLIR